MDWTASRYRSTLNRLGDREIAAIIDSVTGNKLLSPSIRGEIIERTDGIPSIQGRGDDEGGAGGGK